MEWLSPTVYSTWRTQGVQRCAQAGSSCAQAGDTVKHEAGLLCVIEWGLRYDAQLCAASSKEHGATKLLPVQAIYSKHDLHRWRGQSQISVSHCLWLTLI